MARIHIALLTIGLALAGATSAGAAFMAETEDPSGDSTGTLPGHDLLGAGIGFDQKTGLMAGVIVLRGAPDPDQGAFLTLYAGMMGPGGCDRYPIGGFGSYTDNEYDAIWVQEDGPGDTRSGGADKSTESGAAVQIFEARAKGLAGKRWNCLGAFLTDPDDSSIVYDTIQTVRFRGLPAISMRLPEVRRPIPLGKRRAVKLVVRNPGDGPLRNVRLRVRRARGLKVAPRRRLIEAIRPGRRKVIRLRVRLTRAGGSTVDLRASARAVKLRAEADTWLRLKLPKKKPPKGGGSGGSGVCVQYFPDLSGESGGSLGMVPC